MSPTFNNINSDFYPACELADKEFSHTELIEMLKNGNIPQKQIAALKLDFLADNNEGQILISNLTGCDGKIREAVALKINQLLTENETSANFLIFPEVFADASIDINANICRYIIDSVAILKKYPAFPENYLKKIFAFINETFGELDKFICKDKKYVINKQLFKLYWCLESIKLFVNDTDEQILLPILERCADEREYTIREKVANIIVSAKTDTYKHLADKLKNDENYYVRAAFS